MKTLRIQLSWQVPHDKQERLELAAGNQTIDTGDYCEVSFYNGDLTLVGPEINRKISHVTHFSVTVAER